MPEQTVMIPDLIRQTFSDPRGAATTIIRMDLPAAVLWEALALVVALSVIAAHLTTMLLLEPGLATGEQGEELIPAFLTNPLMMSFIQGTILVIMVYAVHWIGRSFGGEGRLPDAIALVVWLQFLLLCLQVVQALLGVLSPALSSLVGLAGVVLFFWLLTQFIQAIHGFRSAGMVFVMIVVSMLAITFAVTMLLAILGIGIVGEAPNV